MNTDDAWPGHGRPAMAHGTMTEHRHICVRACSTGGSRDRAHICQTLTPRAVFSIGAAAMAVVVRA
jgi:hypothetical protein